MAWLAVSFTVASNPGNNSWTDYYLYGLERVGSLLETEWIGSHPWYLIGARSLLERQRRNGSWSSSGAGPDTCFALLFLKRATAPGTGPKARAPAATWRTGRASEVQLAVAGGSDGEPLQMYLEGPGPAAKAGIGAEIPVWRVQYLVNGAVVDTVDAEGSPWREQAYLRQHMLERDGVHEIVARMEVGDAGDRTVLTSTPVTMRASQVFAPWMTSMATSRARNLLLGLQLDVQASSIRDPSTSGAQAVDGSMGTRWEAALEDRRPTLTVSLASPIRAERLVVAPAQGTLQDLETCDRIMKLQVQINREPAFEVEAGEDPLAPLEVGFGRALMVRQIVLTVVERSEVPARQRTVGIEEISLEGAR